VFIGRINPFAQSCRRLESGPCLSAWPLFDRIMGSPDVSRRAVEMQRAYYTETAHRYDDVHQHDCDEHGIGLAYMIGMIEFLGVGSVLDIGSGTGYVLLKLKEKAPHIRAVGVEPSLALRTIGYGKGLTETELVDGDATRLEFPDNSFDLVCEFATLHHMPRPELAISEMLRVARSAIFVSDTNNFGQGSKFSRCLKQAINALGLWPVANWLKTKGRGYAFSDGDGIAYSYSVFTNYKLISGACESVYLLNTANSTANLYRSAPHVALLGIVDRKAIGAKEESAFDAAGPG
jgi:ubiquinone/menaquinone biosynthesis C-methylase UbiE